MKALATLALTGLAWGASAQWVAFNEPIKGAASSTYTTDFMWLSPTNTGRLLNITNGAQTGVTLTLTNFEVSYGGTAALPTAGTPRGQHFHRVRGFLNGFGPGFLQRRLGPRSDRFGSEPYLQHPGHCDSRRQHIHGALVAL